MKAVLELLWTTVCLAVWMHLATAELQVSCMHHLTGAYSCDANDNAQCEAGSNQVGPRCEVPVECDNGDTDCTFEEGVIENTDKCSSASICICKEGYQGDDCMTKGIEIACSIAVSNFEVTVNTLEVADGVQTVAYFSDTSTFNLNSGCQVAVNSGSPITKTFPTDEAGADCDFVPNENSNVFDLYMYLQLAAPIIGDTDQAYWLKCTPGSDDAEATITSTTLANEQIAVVGEVSDPLETTVTTEGGYTMTLVNDDDSAITADDDIAVGSELKLTVTKEGSFTIKSCEASNNPDFRDALDGGDAAETDVSITFIDDLCVSSPYNSMFYGDISLDVDTNTFSVPLKAVYFPGASSNLYLRCTMCKAGSGCKMSGAEEADWACNSFQTLTQQLVISNNNFSSRRRRRRQADQLGTTNSTTSLGVSLEITTGKRDLSVHIKEQSGGSTDDVNADCYKSTSVLLPVILLAVLLVVTMAITFFFCLKAIRFQERRDSGETNMSYKS